MCCLCMCVCVVCVMCGVLFVCVYVCIYVCMCVLLLVSDVKFLDLFEDELPQNHLPRMLSLITNEG